MEDSRLLLEKVVGVIQKHKALDVLVLEVRNLVGYTDYFVICSGQSDRQVQAIAQHLLEEMRAERVLPLGVEGLSRAQWVLVDYNDVVVHVFQDNVRGFYDLEGLWSDAPRLTVVDEHAAVAAAP
jgi:ribosome-associated protein